MHHHLRGSNHRQRMAKKEKQNPTTICLGIGTRSKTSNNKIQISNGTEVEIDKVMKQGKRNNLPRKNNQKSRGKPLEQSDKETPENK